MPGFSPARSTSVAYKKIRPADKVWTTRSDDRWVCASATDWPIRVTFWPAAIAHSFRGFVDLHTISLYRSHFSRIPFARRILIVESSFPRCQFETAIDQRKADWNVSLHENHFVDERYKKKPLTVFKKEQKDLNK